MKNFFLLFAWLTLYLIPKVATSQQLVTVTDCNLNGWVRNLPSGTTISFINGPAVTPLGKGSIQFNAPLPAFVRVRNINYSGTLLSSITELNYSTYIQQAESNLDVPFVILQIDNDGNGTVDNPIVFNPRWQTGNFIIGPQLPDQGVIKKNIWQTWDALNGGWWTGPDPNPDNSGLQYKLSTYISQYPNARIMNDAGGGIRLNGSSSTIFSNNFIGNADNFRIGVSGLTTIYDFEFTTANVGNDKTVIYGYGSNCTTLSGTAAGGVAPYSYSWLPGGSSPNSASTEVCPTVTTTYTLTVTDASGCIRTDDVTVFVNDVRCGNELDKVKVCHHGEEICIAAESVQDHLTHGDVLGSCASPLKSSAINQLEIETPGLFKLFNFPNPFSKTTNIRYEIPFRASVTLKVFDLNGREIKTLVNGEKNAGLYSVDFDAMGLPGGIYYYRLIAIAGNKLYDQSKKMVLIQ